MTDEKNILSPTEEDLVGQFIENEELKEAVRKVLFAGLYSNGVIRKDIPYNPQYNVAFGLVSQGWQNGKSYSDEEIGRDIKILWEATQIIQQAFNELEKYKRNKVEINNKENDAR